MDGTLTAGATPGPLSSDRFRPLAGPAGTLAHPASPLAWFQGRLHLGTADAEGRASLLALDPATGAWEGVLGDADLDTEVTALAVLQGPGDAAPCLYAGLLSLDGGLVLRSEDGRRFAPASKPGLDDPAQLSISAIVAQGGRLIAATAGRVEGDRVSLAPGSLLHAASGTGDAWIPACAPGFGDAANRGILALASAHGHLYAGTAAPFRGFQLWRTRAQGDAPFAWDRVLIDGAWRYSHNPALTAMVEFGGDLYLGSGLADLGDGGTSDPGPCAAELLRLRADGTWDLLAGEPRFTPDGLKVPLSALGPGPGDAGLATIRSLAVHEGVLYAVACRREGDRRGDQLWASEDGDSWTRLLGGSERPLSLGTLCSTADGLVVGASPLGETAGHSGSFGLLLGR